MARDAATLMVGQYFKRRRELVRGKYWDLLGYIEILEILEYFKRRRELVRKIMGFIGIY